MRLSYNCVVLAGLIGSAHLVVAEDQSLAPGHTYGGNFTQEYIVTLDGTMVELYYCENFDFSQVVCVSGEKTCEELNADTSVCAANIVSGLASAPPSRTRSLSGVLKERSLQPQECFAEADHIVRSGANNGACNDFITQALGNQLLSSVQFLAVLQCDTCECSPELTVSKSTSFMDPGLNRPYCEYEVKGACDGVCVGGGGGGAGGDPHFHTIHDEYYGYHGICDLVMVKSASFASGKGLDLHIRTEEREGYSSISNAALRIGKDVLEVVKDGSYLLNGERGVELPTNLAGFSVSMQAGKNTDMFFADVSHGFVASELHESSVFSIDLGEGDNIEIQVWRGYLWVNVNLNHSQLMDIVGLMGTWGKRGKIARDGETNMEDPDQFGQEWQVLESEPKLFHSIRAPQHPDGCVPTESVGRRRLGSAKLAAEACAHVQGPKKEFCMFDVSVTGDMKMASAPFYQ